ncbi:MAG: hypothetical protein ACO3FE_19805, partial [Planctomycetaceae bacterium]
MTLRTYSLNQIPNRCIALLRAEKQVGKVGCSRGPDGEWNLPVTFGDCHGCSVDDEFGIRVQLSDLDAVPFSGLQKIVHFKPAQRQAFRRGRRFDIKQKGSARNRLFGS